MNDKRTLRIGASAIALAISALAMIACGSSGTSTPSTSTTTGSTTPTPAPTQTTSPTSPEPTFTDVYTTIITGRCAPCHTTSDGIGVSEGHLDMTSQSAAFADLVNTAAAGVSCGGKGTRVVPGAPESSIMYMKVSLADPAPCGSKMPLGGPPITQDQDDMIKAWITAGAKND